MNGRPGRAAIFGPVLLLLGVGVFVWLWTTRTDVAVLGLYESEPGLLDVGVSSCNGAPVADVEDLGDGRYAIEARTTQRYPSGEDCADIVRIEVDRTYESYEVVDRVSGETFVWPEVVVEAVDISGSWRMIEVDGEPVETGVNTIEIPEFTIDAGFLTGSFGCNSGAAELLQSGSTFTAAIESTEELCSIPDGSEQMVPTERVLTELFANGATVDRNDDAMSWTGAAGTLRFELVE